MTLHYDLASAATLTGALIGAIATALITKLLIDAGARKTAHARFLVDRYLPIWEDLRSIIGEYHEVWSMLLPGDNRSPSVYSLSNDFFEESYLGSRLFTDVEILGAFNRGEERYHEKELNEDIWDIVYSDFQSHVETAFGVLVIIGKQLESLKPEMELEGIGRKTVKRVGALAADLRKFDGYRLVDGETLLTGGWWHSGPYGQPLVEVLSDEELAKLRATFFHLAKDAYWLYRKVLRTHRRESFGSLLYRAGEAVCRMSTRWWDRFLRFARIHLRLEYGKPLREAPWVDRWRHKTLNVKVRYKHVAPALNSIKFVRAKLLRVEELGPRRGVILIIKCRVDEVALLMSILDDYTFRKPKKPDEWVL